MAGRVDGAADRRVGVALGVDEQLDGAADARRAPATARGTGPGSSNRRSSELPGRAIEKAASGAIRFEPQRSCSFGTVVGVGRALLVAADRLVLDARGRRRGRGRAARRAPAAPRARRSRARAPTVAGAAAAQQARADDAGERRRRSRAGSSNGSRAERSRSRASGSTAIASARRSGPRTSGVVARRPRARLGFGPEATSIEPSGARAAAAHEVGPWISRPLRSAIPPSAGSGGSAGAVRARSSAAPACRRRRRRSPRARRRRPRRARRRRGSAARLEQAELALRAEAVDGRRPNALRNQWLSLKPAITIGTTCAPGSSSVERAAIASASGASAGELLPTSRSVNSTSSSAARRRPEQLGEPPRDSLLAAARRHAAVDEHLGLRRDHVLLLRGRCALVGTIVTRSIGSAM